jgi:hypothetical protein
MYRALSSSNLADQTRLVRIAMELMCTTTPAATSANASCQLGIKLTENGNDKGRTNVKAYKNGINLVRGNISKRKSKNEKGLSFFV